jgi:outer membrane protein assembly factor BamE (lipoprotein component of BamABCDE complex)
VDTDQKREIIGIASSVLLVIAVIVIGWRLYSASVGKKKAMDLFSAAGIPQEKLAQIKIGMTKDEVLKITGEPMAKSTYSDGVTDRWDWMTDIVEFRNGKVTYAGSSRKYNTGPGGSGGGATGVPSGPGGG